MRSPGSVSLTKSERKRFHFNYFSVDYEEELSALYGPYLERQTQFLHHAILRILQCYDHLDKEKRPSSVVTIGHSMGGIVLRGLLTIPTFDHNLLSVIINLATPQVKPAVMLDEFISSFYKKVNNAWLIESSLRFKNITLFSLGGGFRDYLVRSDLCLFDVISSNEKHFSAFTTSLPNIWLENDHQCIVWCNQLVRALTRAFFNMIDDKTRQISTDHDYRFNVLYETFYFKNSKGKQFQDGKESCKVLGITEHMVSRKGCYRFSTVNTSKIFNIWALSERPNWFFHCNFNKQCTDEDSETFLPGPPMSQFHRFVLEGNSDKYYILKSQQNERYLIMESLKENNFLFKLPYFLPVEASFDFVNTKTFYTVINLLGFTDPWQTYNITLNVLSPKKKSQTIVKVVATWSNESYTYVFNQGEKIEFLLRLFVRKPTVVNTLPVYLHIWHEDISRVNLFIQPSFIDCIGQILRFNVDQFLRYSLIFHLFCATVQDARVERYSCFYLFLRFCHFLLFTPGNLQNSFTLIVPEIFLLTSAFVVANVFQLAFRIFLLSISAMAFIPQKLVFLALRKMKKRLEENHVLVKLAINSSYVVAVICALLVYGEVYCLALLLMINILMIALSAENENSSAGLVYVVLPVVLLFIAVPVIVHVKDVLDGFHHPSNMFSNLTVVAISYAFHLLLMSSEVKIKNRLYVLLLLIFMFSEIFEFYNITYALVVYFVTKICGVILETRRKVHKKLD